MIGNPVTTIYTYHGFENIDVTIFRKNSKKSFTFLYGDGKEKRLQQLFAILGNEEKYERDTGVLRTIFYRKKE